MGPVGSGLVPWTDGQPVGRVLVQPELQPVWGPEVDRSALPSSAIRSFIPAIYFLTHEPVALAACSQVSVRFFQHCDSSCVSSSGF